MISALPGSIYTIALLGLWGMFQLLSAYGVFAYWRHMPRDGQTETAQGVVVIVPVRGPVPDLARYVAAVLDQTGTAARAIFTIATMDDAAYPFLSRASEQNPQSCSLVIAGLAADEGQKIHNLRAALATLRPDDAYLVFLDADMIPPQHLIGRLLFPLVRGKAAISTGYRWLVPDTTAPVSWLTAAINLQVATLPRLPRWTLPWGGAMALSRETFDRLGIAEAWRGALSDDLSLYRAAHARGARIRSMSDLLLPSTAEPTFTGLWKFGVRQYRHLFWNTPVMWVLAMMILGVQSAGWVAAWTAIAGHLPLAARAIALGYICAGTRAVFRIAIARRLTTSQALNPGASVICDLFLPFVVCWLHLLMILAAPCSRRIRWAGIDYWMRAGRVYRMQRL